MSPEPDAPKDEKPSATLPGTVEKIILRWELSDLKKLKSLSKEQKSFTKRFGLKTLCRTRTEMLLR